MPSRLATIAADLPARLEGQSVGKLRRVAASVAQLAIRQSGLADSGLAAALIALRDGLPGDLELRSAVQQITATLDEAAWDAQEKADEGLIDRSVYRQAFRRARAAASMGFALEPDALHAASEAVYEAQAAVADLVAVRAVVDAVLTEPD
jgi:hypothetical protein